MRMLVNRKRMTAAGALSLLAVAFFTLASTLRTSGVPGSACNSGQARNEAVFDCVADRAAATSPGRAAFIAASAGFICLAGAGGSATGAVRRVKTLYEAAEELQLPVDQARELVTQGRLRNYSRDAGHVYLDRNEVRSLALSSFGPRDPRPPVSPPA